MRIVILEKNYKLQKNNEIEIEFFKKNIVKCDVKTKRVDFVPIL